MKALSVWQPWAYLLMHPEAAKPPKDIENRGWKPPMTGVILLHASRTFDKTGYEWILSEVLRGRIDITNEALFAINEMEKAFIRGGTVLELAAAGFGALLGKITVTGWIQGSRSPWYCGPIGWMMANPQPFPQPIACMGRQGLFNVDLEGLGARPPASGPSINKEEHGLSAGK